MRAALTTFVVLVAALPACAEDGGTELVVLGASSLTAAFGEIEVAFEAAHPDIDVVTSFDASSTLANQVAAGGPGDVLATADPTTMALAVDAGAVTGDPVAFATNTGVLARPADNAAVTTPTDLEDDGVLLAVCAPEVPCGVVARELFDALDIDPRIASEEANVGAVLTKLEADEVDAGVVYATDDLTSEAVVAIPLPDGVTARTTYPIAAVRPSEAAEAFIAFVNGPEGQGLLHDAGFLRP